MRFAAILILCVSFPVLALAGDPPIRTCDQCVNFESTLLPTMSWQTVSGSTVGEANGEYAYSFTALGGGTYTFTTCDGSGYPGGANYDTALSVWTISGAACGTSQDCNDDNCSGGTSGLLSTITWTAPSTGDYIIVVDGYSSNTGSYTLGYMGPSVVPVQPTSWGAIKATFE